MACLGRNGTNPWLSFKLSKPITHPASGVEIAIVEGVWDLPYLAALYDFLGDLFLIIEGMFS